MNTNSNKVTRGEAILNKWVKEKKVTQQGKNWLMAALDPFHDVPMRLEGWPDAENGFSVLRQAPGLVTLKSPFATNVDWDLYIVRFPCVTKHWVNKTTLRHGNRIRVSNPQVLSTFAFGGLAAYAVTSGTPLNLDGSATSELIEVIIVPSAYLVGSTRVIADGFEVIDATAEINKQGSCTIFKLNQFPQIPTSLVGGDGASTSFDLNVVFQRCPPTTLDQATKTNGSITWEAKHGCYVPSVFSSIENPPLVPGALFNAYEPNEQSSPTPTNQLYVPELGANATIPTWLAAIATHSPVPVHMTGAIFSGLSSNAKFIMKNRCYIETFPGNTSADLALASPSAEFDPIILQIYTHAISRSPVGCKQGENPLGEWFSEVVGQIGNALAYIPHPLAQAGSIVAHGISDMTATKRSDKRLAKHEERLRDNYNEGQGGKPRQQRLMYNPKNDTVYAKSEYKRQKQKPAQKPVKKTG